MATTADSRQIRLTEKFDISIDKLEPKYISECKNSKELEKILRILRSGEEGVYPHVEQLCEKQIYKLNPKSRSLRKEERLASTNELPKDDRSNILDDMKNWTVEMKTKEKSMESAAVKISSGITDESLPPVRGNNSQKFTRNAPSGGTSTTVKNPKPRDYKEWDKVIRELDDKEESAESDQTQTKNTNVVNRKGHQSLSSRLQVEGMTDEDRETLANREKDKGNEAFRSGDFHEALLYYNRSISVLPTAATFNNRALAYVRLNKWTEAVTDCNTVLEAEPDNVKAKLRRAVAYKSLRKFKLAKNDVDFVLEVEPNNKRAKDILKEITPELAKDAMHKAEGKGHRMVIEETDGESEEEVEIPTTTKANVNGTATESVNSSKETDPVETSKPSKRVVIEETDSDSDDESVQEKDEVISDAAKPAVDVDDVVLEAQDSTSKIEETTFKSSENTPTTNAATSNNEKTFPSSNESGGSVETSLQESENVAGVEENNSQSKENQSCATNADEVVVVSSPKTVAELQGDEVPPSTLSEVQNLPDVKQVPAVIKVPSIPDSVNSLKTRGNEMFRAGQYPEAIKLYSQAITSLESDKSQAYNVATLYSNRAACYLKTGDLRTVVKDCDTALDLASHNPKALLRRATAYEMREKYVDAYVDYRHVLNLDPNAESAKSGANRCQNLLTSTHGTGWRSKMPKIPSTSDLPKYEFESPQPVSTNQKKPAEQMISDQERFTQLKDKGNEMVAKGDFATAIEQYTQAIQLQPDNVIPYSNRALCYLRRDQPTKALEDCNTVLALDTVHIKALFRRAQAHKMLKQYRESLADLMSLLKLDSGNVAAKKESDLVKGYYKEQLQAIKNSASHSLMKSSSKNTDAKPAAKRIVIEEGSSDEEEEKVSRSANRRQKKNNKSKHKLKKATVSAASDSNPTVPKLTENATAYEFTSAWTSLRKCTDNEPYAKLIRQIPPSRIVSVLSNKLEADMLERIVSCLDEQFACDELELVQQYLKSISTVPRFSMTTMLMSVKSKSTLSKLFSKMERAGIEATDKLRLVYGL